MISDAVSFQKTSITRKVDVPRKSADCDSVIGSGRLWWLNFDVGLARSNTYRSLVCSRKYQHSPLNLKPVNRKSS